MAHRIVVYHRISTHCQTAFNLLCMHCALITLPVITQGPGWAAEPLPLTVAVTDLKNVHLKSGGWHVGSAAPRAVCLESRPVKQGLFSATLSLFKRHTYVSNLELIAWACKAAKIESQCLHNFTSTMVGCALRCSSYAGSAPLEELHATQPPSHALNFKLRTENTRLLEMVKRLTAADEWHSKQKQSLRQELQASRSSQSGELELTGIEDEVSLRR